MNKTFSLGLTFLCLLSLGLRFWGLERFNTLVFDEVYFAQFGNNYLTNTPFFNAHPPLSQYIIALGIWVGSHLPFGQDTLNGLTGSLLSPWAYRWLNALTGSFIPLVVAGIAYQLSHRHSFALLAGLFTACDGLFLVESRYALNNIYIVIFGLLGQWFLLLRLDSQDKPGKFNDVWLLMAGMAFGASAGTKWNGLWFLLGVYLIWGVTYLIRGKGQKTVFKGLENLYLINPGKMLFFLGFVPALVYGIIWIPHLQLDKSYGFIEVHKKILSFHLHLGGNTPDVHPYCSPWYKWPLMIRPMAYYYQTTTSINDSLPVLGPPLPMGTGKVVYAVHALGNPWLWWLGLLTIIVLSLFLTVIFISKVIGSWGNKSINIPVKFNPHINIAFYLVVNYAANLLPWTRVTRCVFIYHYMPAVVFAFLSIAWLTDQCLSSYYRVIRGLGITIIFLILAGLIFWLPIYLGLPLSPEGYRFRMWFNSWI